MKICKLLRSKAILLTTSSFLSITSISAWAQTKQNPSNEDQAVKTKPFSAANSTSSENTNSEIPANTINLSPIRVKGAGDPLLDSMKYNPDEDHSGVGKPSVLTSTTTYKTFRDLQIDNLSDYARRVDAAVNYNANNFSINMRGLDQNRLLTTIDGIRMTWANDGAFSAAFNTAQGGVSAFDFNALGAIDVIKSADSSFFGTGSLGGVIALRTLDPEDILKAGKNFGGLTKLTYDGSSESAILNQAFAARYKNTVFLLQGGYNNGSQIGNMGNVRGYDKTRTKQNPASYDQGSFLGKIRHYFSGGHRLGITGEWFDRNYDEHSMTSQRTADERYRTRSENQRSRFSATYDYKAKNPTDLFSEGHFTAYWQKVNTITDINDTYSVTPRRNSQQNLNLEVQSYGVTGSAVANVFTGPFHHAIAFGGETYLTDTSQYQGGKQATPNPFLHNNFSDMPNVHGTDLGAILQDRIGAGRDEWFHITPGFRFDYFRRDPHNSAAYQRNPGYAGLPHSAHGSHFSPKVLMEMRLMRDLTFYTQYSQAFRAPSATEEYLSYSTRPVYTVTGNPDLKPETSKGWEVGMKYGNSKRGGNISFYDNYYKNYIDMMGLSNCKYQFCYGYTNLSHVRIYGVEANGNWDFDNHWHGWASFAYANGRNTDQDYKLASVAPFRGIVGFGYKETNWGTDLSTTFAIARKNAKYTNNTGVLTNQWNTPAYAIFDLTGWYSPTFYRPLRIQAGMYNIFDKAYYNAASLPYGQGNRSLKKRYYTQTGRSFKVTARIEF